MDLEFFFRIKNPGNKALLFDLLSHRSHYIDQDMFRTLTDYVCDEAESPIDNWDVSNLLTFLESNPKLNGLPVAVQESFVRFVRMTENDARVLRS